MILKKLKSNSSVSLFLVPLVTMALWVKSLLHPFAYNYFPGEDQNILYDFIYHLVNDKALVQVISGIVMVVLLAYSIQLVNDRYMFIRIKSKLPALLFVVIVGGFVPMHTLHPVYFGALFTLIAIYRLFGIFDTKKAYSSTFDVGFLLGIGALFYLDVAVLIPAFIVGIALLGREVGWREFTTLLLGFFLPFVFSAAYAVLTDSWLEVINMMKESTVTPVNHFKSNTPLQVYLVALILFTIAGSIGMFGQYDTKKISSRKYFTVFFWIFIFSLAGFALNPVTSQEMLVITAIPVTYLIANYFVFMKSRFWSELLFILLVLIVVSMQFSFDLF
ncbi:hypothetical protein SAMN05444285_10330 [Draconibacterium orientale]|uniref:Beta-carotene 15,15'-monooxygenase n=1 Tax=Draconibacterium orientale TaxID=1168034 RepID=X5E552_9BACT|nr:DUF6427 family protein [Draconibacterium orientale]AHW61741.1 hypothetical protein FH5T_07395 [Draconibacterium orientale]SES88417.1 hypothetical protein SAMN05444285_10330 [Draconibacterium orientale]